MRLPYAACAASAAVSIAVACSSATEPSRSPLSARAQAFIAGQPVPQPQPASVGYVDASAGVTLFALSYGPANDCLSGCFYAHAYGLEFSGRVGWVAPPSGPGPYTTFDVQPGDTALFAPAFLDRLKGNNIYLYDAVATTLACDADTPAALRRTLAAQVAPLDPTRCAPLP